MLGQPAVSIRLVHAEPESDPVASAEAQAEEVGWLALWEDRSITYHRSARASPRQVADLVLTSAVAPASSPTW